MKKYIILTGLFLLCVCLLSCTKEPAQDGGNQAEVQDFNFIYEDTAILVMMDTVEKSITFQNVDTGLRYTLEYDGVTHFNDKYGTAMSDQQVKCGVVANITFRKEGKKLLSLDVSPDYFVYSDVDFHEFTKQDSRFTFLGEEYKLDEFLVITDGNNNLEKMELSESDVISICGREHTIYGIYLQSGHGYLRLENDEYFVGGWIEVGNKIIRPISEDMLLTVPEGTYHVLVSNDGITGTKKVTIGRGQEVTLDLGDIDVEKKYGNVLFVLNPSNAELFVDGSKVDTGAPVSLEYGIHQLICRADGYDTTASYIKVGNESASVTLTLTKTETTSEEEKENQSSSENSSQSSSQNSSQSSSQSSSQNNSQSSSQGSSTGSQQPSDTTGGGSAGTTSTNSKVYIDGPEGTEVYVDGNYVGIAPVSFGKTEGSVIITLRKPGYQTRSYTLQLENEEKDVHYSFSDLTQI